MREVPDKAIDLIKRFEGFEEEAYQDVVGVWTIGYGHTKTVKAGDVVTESEATELLRQDVSWAARGILRNTKVPLTDGMYGALVSFAFNLGVGAYQRSTLRAKLNREEIFGAALEFPRWNKAGGRVLRGLTRRRLAEQKLFLDEFL